MYGIKDYNQNVTIDDLAKHGITRAELIKTINFMQPGSRLYWERLWMGKPGRLVVVRHNDRARLEECQSLCESSSRWHYLGKK